MTSRRSPVCLPMVASALRRDSQCALLLLLLCCSRWSDGTLLPCVNFWNRSLTITSIRLSYSFAPMYHYIPRMLSLSIVLRTLHRQPRLRLPPRLSHLPRLPRLSSRLLPHCHPLRRPRLRPHCPRAHTPLLTHFHRQALFLGHVTASHSRYTARRAVQGLAIRS